MEKIRKTTETRGHNRDSADLLGCSLLWDLREKGETTSHDGWVTRSESKSNFCSDGFIKLHLHQHESS